MKIKASLAEAKARLDTERENYCLLVVEVDGCELQLKLPSHQYYHLYNRMGINPYEFFEQIADKLNS